TSTDSISFFDAIPSVRAKPRAKSSRSEGVAIITAWVEPLKDSATAHSSGSTLSPATGAGPKARRGVARAPFMPLSTSFRPPDPARLRGLGVVFLLPFGRAVGVGDLHRRHLVFRAGGRPVAEDGGDDIGLGVGVVEGGVDHARRRLVG